MLSQEERIELSSLPKRFGWLVVLKRLRDKGYTFRFVYNINGKTIVSDKLTEFVFDEEYKGFEPVVPDRIEIFKRSVTGEEIHVGTVRNERGFLDPDPDETIKIFELIERI